MVPPASAPSAHAENFEGLVEDALLPALGANHRHLEGLRQQFKTLPLGPLLHDGHLPVLIVEVHQLAAGPAEDVEIDLDAFERGDVSPNGYTTAFLFTLARMEPLADPHGHLARLRQRLATYPEATRDRLLDRLPRELPNYLDQLRKAQRRRDWTGVINRRSALQEAWFDLLFAINRHYHPGEKRLLSHLAELPVQPPDAVQRWSEAALAPGDDPGLVDLLTELTDDLLDLCRNR